MGWPQFLLGHPPFPGMPVPSVGDGGFGYQLPVIPIPGSVDPTWRSRPHSLELSPGVGETQPGSLKAGRSPHPTTTEGADPLPPSSEATFRSRPSQEVRGAAPAQPKAKAHQFF